MKTLKNNKRSLSKRGERNPNSKLRTWIVTEIRDEVARRRKVRGAMAQISRDYGMSRGALHDIISGRRWGWLIKTKKVKKGVVA